MAKADLKIGGMSCLHCVMALKKALAGLHGVIEADVDIGSLHVEYDEGKLSLKDIEEAVGKAGYRVGQ